MCKRIIITGGFRFNCNEAAQPRVLNNARIFRALGYKVVFICWGGVYIDEDKIGDKYFKDGFEYIISKDLEKDNVSLFKRFVNFIYRGKRSIDIIKILSPDIVIGYNPSMYFSLSMLLIGKSNKIVFLSDLTEWYDSREFYGNVFLPFSWINNLNMLYFQTKIKHKIVISNYFHNYYSSNNIILPPLVDLSESKWQRISINKKESALTFIFAGYYGLKDQLLNIIEGVCLCAKDGYNVRLNIFGANVEQILDLIGTEMFKEFAHVIFPMGIVPQDDIPKYYSEANFSFVIREPTRKNRAGFPTKFVESMASGCPVIANNTSDLSLYLKDGINGFLLDAFTSESIASLIKKITLLDEDKIINMKISASKTAHEKFDFRSYIDDMDCFMSKLK